MRRCTRCNENKSLEAFSKSNASKDGYHTWCKPCKAASTREWQLANRDTIRAKQRAEYAADGTAAREQARQWHHANRERSLANKRAWKLSIYGLAPADYERLLASQGGACAICHTKDVHRRKGDREFSVDHCHETRSVRGLLCHHCNVGLGHFFDNPDLMRAAAEYLDQHKKKRSA